MPGQSETTRIVVLGDVQVDCFQSVAKVENKPLQVEVASEPGGAGLTARMLDALGRVGKKSWTVSMGPRGMSDGEGLSCTWHAVKEIPLPKKKGEKKKKDDPPPPWRITDILGNSRVDGAGPLPEVVAGLSGTDVLVVDDANLGLRERPAGELKAGLKGLPAGCRVVYKMARPAAQGNLWEAMAPWRASTTAVIRIDDLRDAGVLISAGLSWEKTCEELAWELRFSKHLVGLWECAAVAVLFPFDAVFLMDRHEVEDPKTHKKTLEQRCRLILDPSNAEGQWHSSVKGRVLGACTLLTAAVAQAVADDPGRKDLAGTCGTALEAMRGVETAGYSRGSPEKPEPATFYPIERTAQALQARSETFVGMDVLVPWDSKYREGWTFLETMKKTKDLVGVASDVLRLGPKKALSGVPVLTYENLSTADRSEIEGYQAVRNLLERYIKGDSKQPLSIAVFGPPGSGKSFGVKQIAKAIAGDVVETKEFNLSQFRCPDELTAALHVARDFCLSGKCPLIFWDEFDSAVEGKPLFWLKYFLAPMQDGEFREGGTNHPTGRAIYVFAGGTKKTFQEFSELPTAAEGKNEEKQLREAKLPDFVSRLKGYINVMGPNQRLLADGSPDPTDRFHMVRRAIILRSQLERSAGHLVANGRLKIDDGLVSAFLLTRVYKHGARSMENIIAMSDLAGRSSFERSRLPSPAQLYVHVEDDFMNIAQQPVFSDRDVESMARKSHECYRKAKFGKGQLDGASREVKLKEGDAPLNQMPKDYRSSSEAFVRSIGPRLAAQGCAVVPMRGVVPLPLPDSLIEQMAEQEHDRWMAEKIASGFRPGYPKNNTTRVHPWLVPWDDLAEDTKELDRFLLRGIPQVLAVAGAGVRLQDGRQVEEFQGHTVCRPWRISVVGHRSVQATPELDLMMSGVMREAANLRPDGSSVEVVSCLADGADRNLASIAVRELQASLKAVLPMPADVYEIDFTPESREEFRKLLAKASRTVLLAPAVRPASYRQGSEFVVDDADVLVGLWDGQPPRGQAGTAVAMVDAFAKRKRVIWIRTPDLKQMSDKDFQRTAGKLKKTRDAAEKARRHGT
jgi:hypothetical protein